MFLLPTIPAEASLALNSFILHPSSFTMTEENIRTINMQQWIKIIFISCILAQIFLLICDYVFNYQDIFEDKSIRRIWNIARENSIPTWFAAMQAQALGITVFLIASIQTPSISRLKLWAWILIGMFFLWIGIDDMAEIHEKLGGAIERMISKNGEEEWGGLIGILLKNPSFAWHAFIAPFFAVCGLLIALFLWTAFWQHNLTRYLVLGFGCWIIAQGIDFTEGLENIDDYYLYLKDSLGIEEKYGVSHTFKLVEEELEMLGTTLLWIGFLHYFANIANGIHIKLVK